MKITISILLIIIVFVCDISFSQEDSTIASFETQHLFSLSSGISFHTVRDEMMSPLKYGGSQIPLEFSYRYRGVSNRHTVLFYFDNTELNSSITRVYNDEPVSHYIKNLNLNFEYSSATKVTTFENFNTIGFLGARFSSMLNM